MKRTMLAFVAVAALTASVAEAQNAPAPAQAAPTPAQGGAAGGSQVQYKKTTVYDFDDDMVEGDLVRPDGELVDTRRGAKHSSLIKIRENFIPEMLKSVEAI